LEVPPLQGRPFQTEAFLDGKDFLFHNDTDRILFRARMASAIFMLSLAILVFAAAYEMFGSLAALLAIALLVFDPNFLAHGALVTTDTGITCFLFATLYLAYRYTKRPTLFRLLLVAVATGLALATKFTGILIFPMFFLLVFVELVSTSDWRVFSRRCLALLIVIVISVGVLWSFYGFRYSTRPSGQQINPPLSDYLKQVPDPGDAKHLALIARTHLLPEAYLYGLANTKITENDDTSYFFGRLYRHGNWFYFPAAFLIKSTLPLLLLLAAALMLIVTGRLKHRRELLFLAVPCLVYLAVAMHSQMNIGFRHLLPIFPFLYLMAAAAAVALIRANRRWSYAIALLLLWQITTSVRVAPAYMAYGNEAWGGPASVHKYLSDANDDWGQQLKATKHYLDTHGIKNCWIAYFVDGAVDPADYGVPCKRLPTSVNLEWLNLPMDVPPQIDGPVLISDSVLVGILDGQGQLNPYEQFRSLQPTAAIQYGLFVYDGHFSVPLATARIQARKAQSLLTQNRPEEALAEAQQAVTVAPNSVITQVALGDVLVKLQRTQEAQAHYKQALISAQTIEPQLQADLVPMLKSKIAALTTP
jgi:tetratricopeptide (TPR) repeat protein